MTKQIYSFLLFGICLYTHGLIAQTASEQSITVMGVGDMMLGTNYPSASYLPPNDGKDILSNVENLLASADVTFGNLEGTLLNSGGWVKKCSDPSKCYAFRMPEHYADYLVDAGFDLISIANNHVGDFGQAGRENTVRVLKEKGFAYAGQTIHPTAIKEIDGIQYGLAAFAPNSGTVDIRDVNNAVAIVEELANEVDIVIVSFHGGAEGSKHKHVTKQTEYFYGENRGNVHQFSHAVIDAGADIVFGHGPHVPRAVELYKDRIIAYSLGNFCTYARFNLSGSNGLAPILEVEIDSLGHFIQGKIHSYKQTGEGGPKIDEENGAAKEIKTLTETDFPDTNISITSSGEIIRKD